jgi:hypothetical protein
MAYANGTLVKGSGPAVYLVEEGRRRWVPNPETLETIGSWENILTITDAELFSIPLGIPLPSAVPLYADTTKDLGFARFIQTQATLDTSGNLNAVTHTWTDNQVMGFTGGVYILFADQNDIVVGGTDIRQFGVDAVLNPFAPHSRVDRWSEAVSSDVVNKTAKLEIVQEYTPRPRINADDVKHAIDTAAEIGQTIQTVVQLVSLLLV